jgi:Xaa-Pro aminopeptidase
MTIKEKITALRLAMKEANIAAWIVPGTDPHMNEYLPKHWSERTFISGFTGSAGKLVITATEAGLWTDGRYFLQGGQQLQDTGIALFKEGIDGTPTITEYLKENLSSGQKVGINGLIIPKTLADDYYNQLSEKGVELVTDIDLLGAVWENRPPLSDNPLFLLDKKVTGESTTSKLERLREAMNETDAALYTTLDEIAWLFNVRGADVDCNPVVMSYAWVEKDSAILFVDEDKVSSTDQLALSKDGITLEPYSDVLNIIETISNGMSVITDFTKSNNAVVTAMCDANILDTPSWVTQQKAIKNEIEIEGTRRAMVKDGVALTQFFMWLEEVLKEGKTTEFEVGKQLGAFRAKQEDYVGPSFAPIVGYKGNGAIIHYSASEANCATITADSSLLLDSGGQYRHGTTDITRTVALGKLSADIKTDFTLVLKGHIQLSRVKFPKNTRGNQLDVLARQSLWNEAKDYAHGTGHGVGHFLNVHEGPQGIRKEQNSTTLKRGMILSNEPGFYVEGKYGIRIENLIVVQEFNDDFFEFETLTLFPIDKNLIDVTLLSDTDKEWLNSYHQEVYEKVSPNLSDVENRWLREKTLPILT